MLLPKGLLAEGEAIEGNYLDGVAELLADLLGVLADGDVAILDEGLLGENGLAVELVEATLGDLDLDSLGLAGLGGLGLVDAHLVLDDLGRDVLATGGDGAGGCGLHGDVVSERLEGLGLGGLGLGERELDDGAELAVGVDVGAEGTVLDLATGEAGDLHVLAHRVDHLGEGGVNGLVRGELGGLEGVHVGRVCLGDDGGDVLGEAGELGVAADEVGLAGDLDERGDLAALGDVRGDGALVRLTASLLDGLGHAHLAKDVDGLLDVAISLDERLLALHHRGVGHLAELLDERGGDLSHECLSLVSMRYRAWFRFTCGRRPRRTAPIDPVLLLRGLAATRQRAPRRQGWSRQRPSPRP